MMTMMNDENDASGRYIFFLGEVVTSCFVSWIYRSSKLSRFKD